MYSKETAIQAREFNITRKMIRRYDTYGNMPMTPFTKMFSF